MRGTNQLRPRCVALLGDIGHSTRCTIHPQRASVCRDYPPSFENDQPQARCDEARAAHGLPPLTPADWTGRDNPDQTPPAWPRVA